MKNIPHLFSELDSNLAKKVQGPKALRILVTGARLPAALEIVRALSAAGAQVCTADSLVAIPAGISRDSNGYVRFPSPTLAFSDFRKFLLKTVGQLDIDLIIPVSEEIFYLRPLHEAGNSSL